MDGMAFTRENEGVRNRVYLDTLGKHTVGVGFNMDAVGAEAYFSKVLPGVDFDFIYTGIESLRDDQIGTLYAACYRDAMEAAFRQVLNLRHLPGEVQCVVADMVFNLGERGFAKFAKTRAALELGDRSTAAVQMEQSAWHSQVPNRAKLCVAIMRPAGERNGEELRLAQKWTGAA